MYRKYPLPFREIPQLSSRDVDYQSQSPRLSPFYKHPVALEAFENVVKNRKSFDTPRQLLYNSLKAQYDTLPISAKTSDHIELLRQDNTFTVVTAHQPSLLTGPLYYIYKICSVIALCKQLNTHYQDFRTVPVFIIGGEDHDFEEIATLHLFNRDFTWTTDQKGATGRMTLEGLQEVIRQVQDTFGNLPFAENMKQIIDEALDAAKNYGDFMIRLTNAIFAEYGLIILNMDNEVLKTQLLPYIIRDLKNEESQKYVQQDQNELLAQGYKPQAHARQVNFFWHGDDRYRVIKEDDNRYRINDQDFTRTALIDNISKRPSSISPNVILRPVYQEIVLPNLAYIGGGGELAYWMERKSLFEAWDIPFPMLIRRDSVLIIDQKNAKFLKDNKINFADLFDREEQLIARFTRQQSGDDFNLDHMKSSIRQIFDGIKVQAEEQDKTLGKLVLAEASKSLKSIDMIEHKMLKAAKQRNEVNNRRLLKLKQRLFPSNNGLQERYNNFIPYYLKYGSAWLDQLIKQLDPLDKSFKILIEESH